LIGLIRAFPTGLPKPKINSNIAHKPKKWLPTDELHARQNGFLLQLQAIYALHCSFAISFFYYFVSGILTPSLFLFFFFWFCSVAVKAMGTIVLPPNQPQNKKHTHTKTNKQTK
jgi:hypothetical protein